MQLRLKVRTRTLRIRAGLQLVALAASVLLTACGGGGGGGGSSSAPSSATSAAFAGATNPVIVSIGANPTTLALGQSTTLTWSSSNASACQASGAWSGAVAPAGTQLVTPGAAGSFTYTLTCDGVTSSEPVVVVAPSIPTPLPTVSLSLAPASVRAGQPSTLTWSTTDAATCTASGAWAGNRSSSGNIAVSQPVAGTYVYNLSCAGAGGNAVGSVTLAVTDIASNVAFVFIDNGPAGANNVINVPFVSVTVCRPGTSTCQTIDHLLVDTGSYGLRIIAPGVLDPALALPAVTGASGNPVGECAQFVSGFFWGSVHRADVKIAAETAASLPIQLVSDTDAAFARIPTGCSNTGLNIGTVARLGANGILGVGLFNQDCGPACATQFDGTYYECTTAACTGTTMPLASQVANPVAAFATDNNGVALAMPAVAAGGATTLTGALIFGIDTQNNNKIGSATVYTANTSGFFTTTYKGTLLRSSFLDSGSNGLFFADATMLRCSTASGFSGFYCPATALSLSAVNTSSNGASGTVNFTLENPLALDAAIRAASVGGSFGSTRRPTAFDWGMPFFFGRTVFIAIDGASTLHGPGPYWAY